MANFPRDSVIIFKSMAESLNKIPDPVLKGKFAIALIKYGIYGDYDHEPMVDALMTQQEGLIDSVAERYEKSKAAGKLGGRKEKCAAEEVYDYVVVQGHSKSEAATRFGVSDRTIYRKLEEYTKAQHFDEESGTWDF